MWRQRSLGPSPGLISTPTASPAYIVSVAVTVVVALFCLVVVVREHTIDRSGHGAQASFKTVIKGFSGETITWSAVYTYSKYLEINVELIMYTIQLQGCVGLAELVYWKTLPDV